MKRDTRGGKSGQGGYRNERESKGSEQGEEGSRPEGDVPGGKSKLGKQDGESESEEWEEELDRGAQEVHVAVRTLYTSFTSIPSSLARS